MKSKLLSTVLIVSITAISLSACGSGDKDKDITQNSSDIKAELTTEATEAAPVYAGVNYYSADKLKRYEEYAALNPELSIETVVVRVNVGLDKPFYSETKTITNPDNILVLCNKYNQLPEGYEPSDLVVVTPSNSAATGLKLRKEAAAAFDKLCEAAKKDGYTILGASGYRSYNYQNTLYNNYVKADGKANADTYSARAGYSEHQTGLAIDVKNATVAYDKFGTTPEYIWAKDNIHKYGFIIRYLPSTIDITGYQSEEWHFRYVGVDIASKVYSLGITYDEYYAMYLNN